MADRTRAFHVVAESTYSTDPDADGSDYLPLHSFDVGYPNDGLELEDGEFKTGRNEASEEIPNGDGGTIDVGWYAQGFTTSAGDAASVPTADGVDLMLNNALGTPITYIGEGVSTGSTTGNVVLDAVLANSEARIPIGLYVAASTRTRFRAVASVAGAPTYTIDTAGPVWEAAPLTGDNTWGARVWYQRDELATAGATLSAVGEIDSNIHTMTGVRHRSLSLEAPARKSARFKSTLFADDWAENQGATKSSLTQNTTWPYPAIGQLAGVWWGDTLIQTSKTMIDFGISSAPMLSTYGTNGRSDDQIISIDPVITVDIIHAASQAFHADRRAGTIRPVLVQIGGLSTTTRANAFCFYAARAQLTEVGWSNDQGYTRRSLKIKVVGSGLASSLRWSFART